MHQGKKEFKKEGKVEESAGVTGHPIYALVVPAPPIAPTHPEATHKSKARGGKSHGKKKVAKDGARLGASIWDTVGRDTDESDVQWIGDREGDHFSMKLPMNEWSITKQLMNTGEQIQKEKKKGYEKVKLNPTPT